MTLDSKALQNDASPAVAAIASPEVTAAGDVQTANAEMNRAGIAMVRSADV
jgi:hypothetical protein